METNSDEPDGVAAPRDVAGNRCTKGVRLVTVAATFVTAVVALTTALLDHRVTRENRERIEALEGCPGGVAIWIDSPPTGETLESMNIQVSGRASPHQVCRYVYLFARPGSGPSTLR